MKLFTIMAQAPKTRAAAWLITGGSSAPTHRHVGDAVHPHQDLLDLGGVDVEAAGDVHVLEPVGDLEVGRRRGVGEVDLGLLVAHGRSCCSASRLAPAGTSGLAGVDVGVQLITLELELVHPLEVEGDRIQQQLEVIFPAIMLIFNGSTLAVLWFGAQRVEQGQVRPAGTPAQPFP